MEHGFPVGDELAVRPVRAIRGQNNLHALAAEYNWPDGVVEAIIDLEVRYPEWLVWYYKGGVPAMPDPVFRAQPRGQGWLPSLTPLEAPTAEQLEQLIRKADGL